MYRPIDKRVIRNLYKMFVHTSGKVNMYDKLFFVVWDIHKDHFTKKFIEEYINPSYIRDEL